jgi:twinkle protein
MQLSAKHLKGLEQRGLSLATLEDMRIYSGRRSPDGSVEADPKGDILCFPFLEYGEELNTKYRLRDRETGERKFWQRKNPVKTFFNAEVLCDESWLNQLEVGTVPLIITEGEIDAMTCLEVGYETSVSVPDGAPAAKDNKGNPLPDVPDSADDIDPENDAKYAFLGRHMEALQRVKHFILATDNDAPGKRLAKELVRRLGAARCSWITYPTDEVVKDEKSGKMRACKDVNEVLMHLGPDAVIEMLNHPRPWPVKGLYKLDDYPDVGEPVTYETGIAKELDEIMRIYPGVFMPVTGIPGFGKSTLVNQIAVNMAINHGWNIALFSGEMPTVPYIANALKTAYLKKHRTKWTQDDKRRAHDFVQKHFNFIDQDPREDEDEMDLDFLLEKAATAVFREGVKLLIIDPWNELEHKHDRHVTLTTYVGDAIRKIKRFARSYDCAVIVVAHPKKVDDEPGLYDISDSAHWANKADIGMVIHSDDPLASNERRVIIKKVRFSTAGRRGEALLDFDTELELFVPKRAA